MKNSKSLLFILLLSIMIFLTVGCQMGVEAEPENLFYKIEHEEGAWPHPVNPTGPVTTDIGYRYEILNGSTIYIKNHTEVDFWFEETIEGTIWTLDQVGHGGSINESPQTLKSNFNESGSYTLEIERGDVTFRVRIEVS